MCVASFFARVNERKLEGELKKKKKRRERERRRGESFPIRKVGVEGGENLVRGVHARISVERRSRERGARSEGGGFSHARGHFCVYRVSPRRTKKKERLLVVSIFSLLTNK